MHTTNTRQEAIQELDWKVISHPPYSPYTALSDLYFSGLYQTTFEIDNSFNNEVAFSTLNHQISSGVY